jgi:hypothetical protein
MGIRGLLFVLSLSLGAFPGGLKAQTIRIKDDPQLCPSCRWVVDTVAILLGDGLPGGGVLGPPRSFSKDAQGRYLTSAFRMGSEIRVFSPTGQFVSSIGREGEGPGEFQDLGLLVLGPADSIWAFEVIGSISVLSPKMDYVRRFPFNHYTHDGVPFSDGQWLINADIPTADRIGFPLHIVSSDGDLGRSFGAEVPVREPGVPYQMMRSLSRSRESCVWSVSRTQYVIEEWCSDGSAKRRLVREGDWFPPYVKRDPVSSNSPPPPWINALQQTEDGLIWVLISVPDDRWGELWEEEVGQGQSPGTRMFDTRLEVIDPETGVLVGWKRIPHSAYGFTQDGEIYTYEEDQVGQPSIVVLRVSIEDSTRTKGGRR